MTTHPSPQPSWPDIIDLLSQLVVFNQFDFQEFLKKFITIASDIVAVDSCLIYFYDKEKNQLILIASKKPHTESLNNITLAEGEGITGWVAKHHQTVAIKEKAYNDVRFKPFKELPEDKYESFLSVPIICEKEVVGVINFQNKTVYSFSSEQIKIIESIGKIIASAFVKTVLERKVTALENKLEERKLVEKAKGVLMKTKHITENEAYSVMRREAMNKRKSMKDIAEAILLVW